MLAETFASIRRISRHTWPAMLCLVLVGCASLATQRMAINLNEAILNHNDPATVKAGAPAYMLMLDGFITESPRDQQLLMAGARLYSTYAGVFVEDEARARRLADKALGYARRAICLRRTALCAQPPLRHDQFVALINTFSRQDVPALFVYASSLAGWILANSADWKAVAELPRVQVMMERVVELDETFAHGQAHLYLGIIDTRLPAAMGGQPETGRAHFERAISLSGGRNLMAKVELARRYARMMFDRPLHDGLLQDVLQADVNTPGLTLSNALARQQAKELLDTSHDYFGK
jgi:hypothetical protein